MDYLPDSEQPTGLRPRSNAPKPIEAWTAPDLYKYLRDRAEPHLRVQLVQKPLCKNFRQWMDAGLTPSQVRAMLDAFLTREDFHNVNGYPAWRILVARRGDLQQMAVKSQQREESAARRPKQHKVLGKARDYFKDD